MVIEYKKKNVPPHLFVKISPFQFWKYSAAKQNEVIEFYFLDDGTFDGIDVPRIQWLKF